MNNESFSTGLAPLKMFSASVSLDQHQADWSLANIEDCATSELRSFKYYVCFDAPFSSMPLVHAGIAGFDIDNQDTSRLSVHVEGISNEGFSIVLQTWQSTRVYMAEVSWIALGSA